LSSKSLVSQQQLFGITWPRGPGTRPTLPRTALHGYATYAPDSKKNPVPLS
jgi:hypothetical protein